MTLLLFSLTTFVLFYNLASSLSGDASRTVQKGASENWDDVIYGNWTWEEVRVAENALKQAKNKTAAPVSFHPQTFGSVGVNDGILDWAEEVPTTLVLEHVPGYTILDNVFVLNGTLFVVTDDPHFPPLDAMASPPSDWQVLSHAQARATLGSFGGVIHGVSWLVTDTSPSNYTLFSLWRTYSALAAQQPALAPPRRIFYPHIPTFMGEQPDRNGPIVPRERSPSGFHPFLLKAAFPTLGLLYLEDWADYALLHVPFLLQRVVVADQGAARRARTDVPPFGVPLLALHADAGWWEPVRRHVARFVGVPEDPPKTGWLRKADTVVTYLARQDAADGPVLRAVDHAALVGALQALGKGYTVQIVDAGASWAARMAAIAQSTIVLGVYGDHLADCVYMPPSTRATVMELFPPGVFARDIAVSVGALQMRYVAWWEARQYSARKLPEGAPPNADTRGEVPIDVQALVKAIKRI